MFGGRVSSVITCSCESWSSAASSTVMMRSPSGMAADSTFRVVVLPEPVPPEMRMFSLPRTQASRNWPAFGVSVPNLIRSSIWKGSLRNFRIVSVGPLTDSGGMIALTREPSGRRASTIGEASSTRRPMRLMILSMMRSRCWSSTNCAFVSVSLPRRSM